MTLFIVLTWLFCAIVSSAIASSKNRATFGWFLLGLVFGPFAFVVALLPKLDPEGTMPDRKCPFCAEMIKAEAIKCRFCGADITPPTHYKINPDVPCIKCGYKPLKLIKTVDGQSGVECPSCRAFWPVKE